MLAMYLALLENDEERKTYEQFYEEHKNKGLYIAIKITRNHALAEDALQNAFFEVAKNWKKFTTKSCSNQAVLFVLLVKHRAIDLVRNTERNAYVELNEELSDLPVESDISVQVVDDIAYQKLLGCINKLPEIYQVTFELRYVLGYNNTEIAGILCIPPKTVSARICRAKAMLQGILDKEGIGYESK